MIAPPVKIESGPPGIFAPGDGRKLAYRLTAGNLPGIVFLSGFRSDMNGAKAQAVERFCIEEGLRCLCFDYSGHGQSGGDFMQCTIGGWKQDALSMLDALEDGPNILVGSSMGGWLATLAALERPQKVRGLVTIAAAPDFTQLIERGMSVEQQQEMALNGVIYLPSCYGQEPYPITAKLLEEAKEHCLLEQDWALGIPVRLIHGTNDEDVPWQTSTRLMERLRSPDISLELVQGGDHRLSDPAQLAVLLRTLEEMLGLVSRF